MSEQKALTLAQAMSPATFDQAWELAEALALHRADVDTHRGKHHLGGDERARRAGRDDVYNLPGRERARGADVLPKRVVRTQGARSQSEKHGIPCRCEVRTDEARI